MFGRLEAFFAAVNCFLTGADESVPHLTYVLVAEVAHFDDVTEAIKLWG